MDPKTLIEFLGHGSIYEPLDDYLLRHGIKKRPKGPDLTDWVSDKATGISLEFSASYDVEVMHPRKSKGQYVLNVIRFEKPRISGLPFGLNVDMSQETVSGILGQPKATNKVPVATYFFHDLIINVRWENDSQTIFMVSVSLPDIFDNKNLGLGLKAKPSIEP